MNKIKVKNKFNSKTVRKINKKKKQVLYKVNKCK